MITILTQNGVALLTEVVGNGGTLEFVRAEFGSGRWTTADETILNQEIKQAQALRNIIDELTMLFSANGGAVQDGHIVINAENKLVELRTAFNNSQIEQSFRLTEIGYWARNSSAENSAPVLFALSVTDESTADYIPSKDEQVASFDYDVYIYVGDVAQVSAAINEATDTASRTEFLEHIRNKNNPHDTTKRHVGLWNVPNVQTNDQAPTFTMAQTLENIDGAVAENDPLQGEEDAPRGKETLSVIFGKVKKAIDALIQHVNNISDKALSANKGNPHGTTAKDVGAASIKHTHSAKDITNDVLPVAHGGTGLSKGASFTKATIGDAYSSSVGYCNGCIELPGGLLVQWGNINVDGHTFNCNFKRSFADNEYALVFPSCGDTFVPVWKNPAKRTDGFTMVRTFGIDSTAANLGVTVLGRQFAKFFALLDSVPTINLNIFDQGGVVKSFKDLWNWLGQIKNITDVKENNIIKVFGASQAADWIAIGKAGK